VILKEFLSKGIGIGQQEIMLNEVYATSGAPGYASWNALSISSILRFSFSSLADWHMARDFGMTPPTLNGAFVTCDPTNRIYADQTGTDTMYMMVNHRLVARRLVMRNPTPRVL